MLQTVSGWIVIPRWEEFQHYRDRDPKWIKVYTRLLADPDYLALTVRSRAVLHGLWMLYAASDGHVDGTSPSRLGHLLGIPAVRARDLERLNHAGFLTFSASKPVALRYQRASPEEETEREEEKKKRKIKPKAVSEASYAENGQRPEIALARLTIDNQFGGAA